MMSAPCTVAWRWDARALIMISLTPLHWIEKEDAHFHKLVHITPRPIDLVGRAAGGEEQM